MAYMKRSVKNLVWLILDHETNKLNFKNYICFQFHKDKICIECVISFGYNEYNHLRIYL